MSPQTRDRWVGFWLALLLGFVYLLTHSWMYHSVDEMSVVSAAKTLLAGDGWHANQMEWEQSWRKSQTMTGSGRQPLPQQARAGCRCADPAVVGRRQPLENRGRRSARPADRPAGDGAHRGRALSDGAAAGVRRRRRGAGRAGVGVGDIGVALLAHALHRAHRGVGAEPGAVRRGHVPARHPVGLRRGR